MPKSIIPKTIPIVWVLVALLSVVVIIPMAQDYIQSSKDDEIANEILEILADGKGTLVECDVVTQNILGKGYWISNESTCRIIPDSCTVTLDIIKTRLRTMNQAGMLEDEDIDKASGVVYFVVELTTLTEPITLGDVIEPGAFGGPDAPRINTYKFGDIDYGESKTATGSICIPQQDSYEISIVIDRPDKNGNRITVIK